MKKLIITTVIVIGFGLTTFAVPNGGGLFQRGDTPEQQREGSIMPCLPSHNQTGNQDAPLGTGIAVLIGLGAAYAIAHKREKD